MLLKGGIIITQNYFNSIAKEWDKHPREGENFIGKALSLLPDFDDPYILDIGTGTGVLIPYLIDEYGDSVSIVALDYAEKMIEIARGKYGDYQNIDFVVDDFYDYQFSHSFDIIIGYSVFPHLPDKEKVLQKMREGLNAGGRLLIFHSASREKINSIHTGDDDSPVAGAHLPPAAVVDEMAEKSGLYSTYLQDDEEGYVLIFKQVEELTQTGEDR